MSFAPAYNHKEITMSSTEKKRKLVEDEAAESNPVEDNDDEMNSDDANFIASEDSSSSDSDSGNQSDDSLAATPFDGPGKYRQVYREVCVGMFKTKDLPGMDHAEFKKNVGDLEVTAKGQVKNDDLYLHVMCNQIATALKLDSGKKWQKFKPMTGYYAKGILPKYKSEKSSTKRRKITKKKTKYDFSNVGSSDESDGESKVGEDEPEFTVHEVLMKHGLRHHTEVHRRVEALSVASYKKETGVEPRVVRSAGASLTFKVHEFRVKDADMIERNLQIAALEELKIMSKSRGTSSISRSSGGLSMKKVAEPVPQNEEEEERVLWSADVLNEFDLEQLIEAHPKMDRILTNLRVSSAEEAFQEIAMKCGLSFINRYGFPKKNEDGKRIYNRAMLPMMRKVAEEKIKLFVNKYD